jgi:integrase
MAKKRGKGEGTIYQRKDGLWTAQITTGINPATGKSVRKTYYGQTRSEAARKMNEGLNKIQKGILETAKRETLNDWFEEWIEGRKYAIEEGTYLNYKDLYRCHLERAIGHIKLKDLKTIHIQTLFNSIHENKKLAVSSLKRVHMVLNACLKKAVKKGLISRNPCDLLELPKSEHKEMQVMKSEELPIFLNAIKNSPHYTAFMLELNTGLRRGELLGITWKDIDLETGTLTIRQQLTGNGRIKGLKTESAYRTIQIQGEIIKILKKHKKQQTERQLMLGAAYNNNDLVFCNDDGRKLIPRVVTAHYKDILKRAGINPKLRFHDLRHSFATFLLETGKVSPKTLSEMLGHSNVKFTLQVYTHVTDRMKGEAAEAISGILSIAVNKH